MRYLILIASLALAANALAEDKPKPVNVSKELDKSTPILATTDGTSDSTDTSSSGQRGVVSPRDAASGMATGKRTHASSGIDYNSSRSNNSSSIAPNPNGGGSGSSGRTRAQDYNSSRSNTTTLREDKSGDLDRDGQVDVLTCSNGVDDDCNGRDASPANHNTTRSNRAAPGGDDRRLREVTCSMDSDACVKDVGGEDLVLRKRPGR